MGKDNDKDRTQDEGELFREQVGEVRPIRSRGGRRPARPAPQAVPRAAPENAQPAERLAQPAAAADVEAGEALHFRRPGLPEKAFRKLRRGQFSTRAEIDLHGMIATEASAALRDFLREAQAENWRCVRVVHGKGLRSDRDRPVLKNLVNRELRRWDCVLAFCSAQPRHGGTGAVYVLLRQPR